MARDTDSTSTGSGQSKRPPLYRHQSDSVSEHHLRHKQAQKQHHVGRMHSRVPSSKALLHKANHSQSNVRRGPTGGLVSPPPEQAGPATSSSSHRRSISEVKLQREAPSPTYFPKNASSQANLKRNRSHGDVHHRRSKSSDKLKRNSSGLSTAQQQRTSAKSQVHFDLGSDGPEDEEEGDWVDASASNSPHLSRKGSVNSSAQSSIIRPSLSAPNSRPSSRPQTPSELQQQQQQQSQLRQSTAQDQPEQPSTPDRERTNHQQYLTSRLLQRTPSQGAPPKMTSDLAEARNASDMAPAVHSPDSETSPTTIPAGSGEGVTSRFVDAPASGVTSNGSFYRSDNGPPRADELTRRPKSTANLAHSAEEPTSATPTTPDDRPRTGDGNDISVLVPQPARRRAAPPAQTSRIQQKLNLQRASSAMEPGGPAGSGPVVPSGVVMPLIGAAGPGFNDGSAARDPRVGRLLDSTGMEYLVVRRHQNPVARSLNRLRRLPDGERPRVAIPQPRARGSMGSTASARRPAHLQGDARSTHSRTASEATAVVGEDEAQRLSGSSLVGSCDEDGTAAVLRNLWEKTMDFSGSAD